jgi:hypothetical protein
MLDWKILAASFAALLIVSSVLIGGLGFTDIVDNIRDWLGGSPFGGIVDFPEAGSKEATVIIYSTPFSFSPDVPINATIGDASMEGFSGIVSADFDALSLEFSSDSFTLSFPISNITLEDISIGKLELDNADFAVKDGELETSAENGTLEFSDFVGSIAFRDTRATLTGNFTSVKGNAKQII